MKFKSFFISYGPLIPRDYVIDYIGYQVRLYDRMNTFEKIYFSGIKLKENPTSRTELGDIDG